MTRVSTNQQVPGQMLSGTTHDFEAIYRAADGNASRVRWDDGRPNRLLVSWLDREAAELLRTGARVAVVGCGLGHDARELARRGYDVAAFDVSPTAIEWAKSIDTDWSDIFSVADLFQLPSRWKRRFDLVVEAYTIQSMPPATRIASVAAIESLLHPHGLLLLICRGADRPQQIGDGPPWALTIDELRELALTHGLEAPSGFELSDDDETPQQRRVRTLLRRSTAR